MYFFLMFQDLNLPSDCDVNHGPLTFLWCRATHLLLWAGFWAAHGKIINGISNHLNYCVNFRVCTYFTNVAAGCKMQPDGPWADNPCCTWSLVSIHIA
jgi:hypothetical protein